MDLAIFGLHLSGISSLLGAMNLGLTLYIAKFKHLINMTRIKVISYGVMFKKYYSTLILSSSNDKSTKFNPQNQKLNPNFLTGFIDAEGSFIVVIRKEPRNKTGWRVDARLAIGLHKKDVALLEWIKNSLGGVGDIAPQGKDYLQFRVSSIKDIMDVVIPHFEMYPLVSQKKADFELFKSIVKLVNDKKHLTYEGILDIVSYKASLNLGLSSQLKSAFPEVIPRPRPVVQGQTIKDPHWLAGFASGEACFFIRIAKSSSTKTGSQVLLKFLIPQHSRDTYLLKSLISYLGCGNYRPRLKEDKGEFVVEDLKNITSIIIPFFKKYPIMGIKSEDFLDFCKASELMLNKEHLNNEGLEKLSMIKSSMNKKRVDTSKD